MNNGVHFVEEEPILLCNMVRLLAAENQLSELLLLFCHGSCNAEMAVFCSFLVLSPYFPSYVPSLFSDLLS